MLSSLICREEKSFDMEADLRTSLVRAWHFFFSFFCFAGFFAFLAWFFIPSIGWAEDEVRRNEASVFETTKLFQAIALNDLVEAKRLYSNLTEMRIRQRWGLVWPNPLSFAISYASPEMVDFFLSLPRAGDWLKEKNEIGETTILTAVRAREVSFLKKIMAFSEMEGLLNEKSGAGWTPFHLAVGLGKLEMVQFLLNYPEVQRQLGNRNSRGETILHMAIKSGKIEMVKAIFGLPETRALILEKDDTGFQVLDLAFETGVPDEVLAFLFNLPEASHLFSLDGDAAGDTVFHRANLPKVFLSVARVLENHPRYPYLLVAKNQWGRTPLVELLIGNDEIDLTKFLDRRNLKSLLFEKDGLGRNLLHIAAEGNKLNTTIQFARLGKNFRNLFDEPDNEGTSPLGIAVLMGQTRIVGALLAEGFDFENVLIHHKRVSAIEYLTQNLTGVGFNQRMELLQFLLSRPAEESQTSGWSPPQ